MRVPASDVSAGELRGRLSWLHLGLRFEADRLDEAQLLAAIAERGVRAVVERCVGDDGLHLRLRLEPTNPVSVLADDESGGAATGPLPSDVGQPPQEAGNSARVRHADPDNSDDVRAVMELATGVLSFIQSSDPPPEWLWARGEPAFVYEDESGIARLALGRSQSSFSTLADRAWLDSLEPTERVRAFQVLLEAAARGGSKPMTAVPLIFPAALFALARELRAAGVIGGPVCELSVAAVGNGHVERVS